MALKTKQTETKDTSFGGRIKKELWAEFKAICDDSNVLTSSVLIEYIKACVQQQSLITFESIDDNRNDSLTDDVNDRLNQLENLVGKIQLQLDDNSDHPDSNLSAKLDQVETQITLEIAKLKSEFNEKINALSVRIDTVESLGKSPSNRGRKSVKHSEKSEFNLADYLTRPDPLTPDPVTIKSVNQWAKDTEFTAKVKECRYGSTPPSIMKNLKSLGLVFARKDKGVNLYAWHPELMVVKPRKIKAK